MIIKKGDKMEFISNHIEIIISSISMIITWVLGTLSKQSPYINNNLIIIQNILIGLVSGIIYYIITKDFSMAITMSGIFAETGYNLIHNIQKLIEQSSSNDSKNIEITQNNQKLE